jgi:hypothetical protein
VSAAAAGALAATIDFKGCSTLLAHARLLTARTWAIRGDPESLVTRIK